MAEVICTGGTIETDVPPVAPVLPGIRPAPIVMAPPIATQLVVGPSGVAGNVAAPIVMFPPILTWRPGEFVSDALQALALEDGDYLSLMDGSILETMEVLPAFTADANLIMLAPPYPTMLPPLGTALAGFYAAPIIMAPPIVVPVRLRPPRIITPSELVIEAPILAEVAMVALIGEEDSTGLFPVPPTDPEQTVVSLTLMDGDALALMDDSGIVLLNPALFVTDGIGGVHLMDGSGPLLLADDTQLTLQEAA